jgi:MFS family permease
MEVTHGIRANLRRHVLLFSVTGFIGAMVGLERTVVPLIARQTFHVASATVALSFIASFGAVKACANLGAGRLADRVGRRRLLVAGWAVGVPVPVLVLAAPSWGWIVAANVALGVSQGLAWTMTVTMMGDLAGSRRRGLAMGANEFAGYVCLALAAWGSSRLAEAHGLRSPFFVGIAIATAGLLASLGARDTMAHTAGGTDRAIGGAQPDDAGLVRSLLGGSPAMVACFGAGLVTKVNDAGTWGLLPLLLAARGVRLRDIGLASATYPLVWGLAQGVTGALSDVVGRRGLIAAGMITQGTGLLIVVARPTFAGAFAAAFVLGLGTALAYPTLLATVGDLAGASWRASALGAYRFWRDAGLAVGALGMGALADASGYRAAILAAAALAIASGLLAARGLPATVGRRHVPATAEA